MFHLFSVSVSQMNVAWEGLDRTWRERMERLEEAMVASVQYQDALQVSVPECISLLAQCI
jgi:hypothetical protein